MKYLRLILQPNSRYPRRETIAVIWQFDTQRKLCRQFWHSGFPVTGIEGWKNGSGSWAETYETALEYWAWNPEWDCQTISRLEAFIYLI